MRACFSDFTSEGHAGAFYQASRVTPPSFIAIHRRERVARGERGVKGGGRGGKGAADERKGTEFIKRCSNCLSTLRGTKIKEAPIIGAWYQRAEKSREER